MDGVAGRVCTGQLYGESIGLLSSRVMVLPESIEADKFGALCAGMSDELTESVAATYEKSGTPMASKYLPYGALREVSLEKHALDVNLPAQHSLPLQRTTSQVLPYLGRRAIENKSLLSGEGGASSERRRVWAEIRRRIGF